MATKRVAKTAKQPAKSTRAAKSVKKRASTEAPKETCFTIMPFGGWFDDYYESIYKKAIEDAGLAACRADDLYRPSTIVHDIWSYTQQAKLVLADLSGKNPNVFYELGLAHALAKPAILIAESIEDVPFDLRALRVLEYNKNQPRWGEELQQRITSSIREVVSSPVQAVLPAFLSVRPESKTRTVSEQEKVLLELRREIDLLRNEVAHTRSVGRMAGPDEAREMIKRYLSRGYSRQLILDKLAEAGVPTDWADKQITIMRKRVVPATPAPMI